VRAPDDPPVKIFTSYASEYGDLAERLALAFEADGHESFLERSQPPLTHGLPRLAAQRLGGDARAVSRAAARECEADGSGPRNADVDP
jgi:hypothetical protein